MSGAPFAWSIPAAGAADASQKSGPATVEEAIKTLDLRTFPRLEGAKSPSMCSLGTLMYNAPTDPKTAFDTTRKALLDRGFKELPGGYSDKENLSAHFEKNGFIVAVSTSKSFDQKENAGWAMVTLVNRGNVDLTALPKPPGSKPFFPSYDEASYTTELSPKQAANACRELLLAEGWEPYGQSGDDPNQKDSSMRNFKRNAINLQAWVMTTPADGGKTLIRYSSELMSADLPAPPNAKDPRYDDYNRKLEMDEPAERTKDILAFYANVLPKMGWTPTTEKPISDARSQFVIYRNSKKDLLSLDLTQFTGVVRVKLAYRTAAEVEEESRLAKERAAKERVAYEKRNRKLKLATPLPASATKIERPSDHQIKFTVENGAGPSTLEAFRDHYVKLGWKAEPTSKWTKTRGDITLTLENHQLRVHYFDIGIGGADIDLSGDVNLFLEPASMDGQAMKIVPKKKPTKGSIKQKKSRSLIPDLPEDVKLPDDVKGLLEKARQDLDGAP